MNSLKACIHKKAETLQTGAIFGQLTSPGSEDKKVIMDMLLGMDPSYSELILFDKNRINSGPRYFKGDPTRKQSFLSFRVQKERFYSIAATNGRFLYSSL